MNNNIITKILGITCLLLVQMTAFAQSRKISGTVTDNNGEPCHWRQHNAPEQDRSGNYYRH